MTTIAKVQVTSDFTRWWESDLKNVIDPSINAKIISAVVENGGLYLIYTYDSK